ncbi:homeobox protein vex1-like [Pelobates fuscus]|uniref:homeobox protein vex1-like n=1 Tax=Pelobates fuscus TaxID=191477 RepID=UPI002FE4E06E
MDLYKEAMEVDFEDTPNPQAPDMLDTMLQDVKPFRAFHSVSWLAQSSNNMTNAELGLSQLIGESHALLNPLTTDLRTSPCSRDRKPLQAEDTVQLIYPGIIQPETVSLPQSPRTAFGLPLKMDNSMPGSCVEDSQQSPCLSRTLSPAGSWCSELSIYDSKASPYSVEQLVTSVGSSELHSPVFDLQSPAIDGLSPLSPSSSGPASPSTDLLGNSPQLEQPDTQISSSPGNAISGRRGSEDSGYGCEAGQQTSSNEDTGKMTRRLRTAFTCEQIATMEKTFKKGKYLTQSSRRKLANKLQLSENQIKTWFQNRRMKQKRETQDVRHSSIYAANLFGLPGYHLQQPGPLYAQPIHSGPQPMAYSQPQLNSMTGTYPYPLPASNPYNPLNATVRPMMYTPQQPAMYPPGYHDQRSYPKLQPHMYPPVYHGERPYF